MNQFLDYTKEGDLKAIQRMIKKEQTRMEETLNRSQNGEFEANGMELNQLFLLRDDKGRTALHIASFYGQTEVAQFLIENEHPIDPVDFGNNTPLHLAIIKGRNETVQLLLGSGASIDSKNFRGFTPIHFAAKSRNMEILDKILGEGCDVNVASSDGKTPIYCATEALWIEGIDKLLSYGAKYVIQGKNTKNPFPLVAEDFAYKEENEKDICTSIAQRLVESGLNPGEAYIIKSGEGKTINTAFMASLNRDSEKLFDVLATRKLLNKKLPDGKSPLEFAILHKLPVDFVEKMINLGANINILIEGQQKSVQGIQQGASLLHLAALQGNADVFNLILDRTMQTAPDYKEAADRFEEDIQLKKEQNGKSRAPVVPMPLSQRFGAPRGVDAFLLDADGSTVLHYAAHGGCAEICERLIEEGVDPRQINKKQQTAFAVSTQETAEAMADLLEANEEFLDKMAALEPYHQYIERLRESPKSSTKKSGSTLQMAARLDASASAKKSKTMVSPIQTARPWGGSAEAESYRRDVRKRLRDLRSDLRTQLEELRNDIQSLREELLPPEDGETEIEGLPDDVEEESSSSSPSASSVKSNSKSNADADVKVEVIEENEEEEKAENDQNDDKEKNEKECTEEEEEKEILNNVELFDGVEIPDKEEENPAIENADDGEVDNNALLEEDKSEPKNEADELVNEK